MDISDIATDGYLAASPDERLGELHSVFEREGRNTVLVIDEHGGEGENENGGGSEAESGGGSGSEARDRNESESESGSGAEVRGVITPREVLDSHRSDDTGADALAKPVPAVDRAADVREVCRLLVESESSVAPVRENGALWGSVTCDAILETVLPNLDVLTVGEIASGDVIDIEPDATMGEAINTLRENGISRLPVTDEEGRFVGVLRTKDMTEFVLREGSQQSAGDRTGDSIRTLDLPVRNVMDDAPPTATPDETAEAATGRMLEAGRNGLVVVPEYAERPTGVLTKTDVLRALSYTQEETMDVQITNVKLLRRASKADVAERIEEIADRYQDMNVIHAHVRFREHKEGLRGEPLVRCEARLRTDQEEVAGTGEGYGADEALRIALDKLERNVLEMKGRYSDEEERGQLLRKLNEL
jgi:CBS domain-containing protein